MPVLLGKDYVCRSLLGLLVDLEWFTIISLSSGIIAEYNKGIRSPLAEVEYDDEGLHPSLSYGGKIVVEPSDTSESEIAQFIWNQTEWLSDKTFLLELETQPDYDDYED